MTSSLRLRPILLLLTLAALALTPAFAMDVTYSTTGSFSCTGVGYSCAGTTLTGPNGLSITFAGQPEQFPNVDVPPASNADFGTFTVTGGSKAAFDNLPANTSFTLNVVQSVPAPGGTEKLTDTFTGSIKPSSSSVNLVFNGGTGDGGVAVLTTDPLVAGRPAFKFSFGTVDYWVDQTTAIHPDTCANPLCTATTPGTSIINGAINTTVPEPMFYGLTGTGLAGLFVMALRRRRQAS